MRIFWFILLKIVEVGGVVFGPLYLGKLVHSWTEWFCFEGAKEISHINDWLIGLTTLLFTIGGVLVIVVVILFLCGNWQLAGKIRDRF